MDQGHTASLGLRGARGAGTQGTTPRKQLEPRREVPGGHPCPRLDLGLPAFGTVRKDISLV